MGYNERIELVNRLISRVFLVSLVILAVAWVYFMFIVQIYGIGLAIEYVIIGIGISWVLFYFSRSRNKE